MKYHEALKPEFHETTTVESLASCSVYSVRRRIALWNSRRNEISSSRVVDQMIQLAGCLTEQVD